MNHAVYCSCTGGLILASPFNNTAPLQFSATAAFLGKLYSDYLSIMQVPGGSCGADSFSPDMLQSFAKSQASMHQNTEISKQKSTIFVMKPSSLCR